ALSIEERAERLERRLVLEAGEEHARNRKAPVAQSAGQRLDRLEIARQIDRAVEDDERARGVRFSLEAGGVETAESGDRRGRRRLHVGGADFGGEKGETGRHVAGTAFVEIPPNAQERAALERRGLVEARVAPPVP